MLKLPLIVAISLSEFWYILLAILIVLGFPALVILVLFRITRPLSARHRLLRWAIIIATSVCLVGWMALSLWFPLSAKKKSVSLPSESPVMQPPEKLPELPWPPMAASARIVLPTTPFRDAGNFGQFCAVLTGALERCGYVEESYYSVPGGLALITRMEQTTRDARPAQGSERWSVDTHALTSLSLSDYLKALFLANTGYYRVIIFVVTDVPFGASKGALTSGEAQSLLTYGYNSLPPSVSEAPLPVNYACTALIYEFEKPEGKSPEAIVPGHLDAKTHLVKSGLWAALHLP
jgi:hypothetical protein